MMKYALLIGGLLAQRAAAQKPVYQFEHTLTTTATPAQIWALWVEVPLWWQWDDGLRSATLTGPFALGARGQVVPDRGPKAGFKVVAYDPERSYTIAFKLPLGQLLLQRRLELTPAGTTAFTHAVRFTGPLRGLFGRSMGRRYRDLLPQVMAKLRTLAEQGQ